MANDTPVAARDRIDEADAALLRDRVTVAFGEQYIIDAELGRGGMAVVYAATDIRLQRRVALKVLPPDLAFRSDVRARFTREAQTAARLNHPHIVPIYAVHEAQGLVCFAMALVEGETLAARLLREPRPGFETVGRILEQTADALAYAHASGVVHRDVKPDNILLDRATGRVMVTDFGIARAAESGTRLTQTGIAVGTPAFMSPEQALGEREVDGRSDLYSLGVVGYLMLAGRLPFEAATTPAMLVKHVNDVPPALGTIRPDAPPAFVEILRRSLAKKADDRWENALQMRDSLRHALRGSLASDHHAANGRGRSAANGSSPNGAGPFAPPATPQSRRFGDHHDDWAPRMAPMAPVAPMGRIPHAAPAAPMAPGAPWVGGAPGVAPHQPMGVAGANIRMMAMPALPPLPLNATKREIREWRHAVREQRREAKERWKLERDYTNEAQPAAKTDDQRIAGFRGRIIMQVALIAFLVLINVVTSEEFPWSIFPAAGILLGIVGEYAKLRGRGIPARRIFGGAADDAAADQMAVYDPSVPQRIVTAVAGFKRSLKRMIASMTVAAGSFAIGSTLNLDPMIVPFVAACVATVAMGGMAMSYWMKLRAIGVSATDALNDSWRDKAARADTRPLSRRVDDDLARMGGDLIANTGYAATLRGAVEDRHAIRETAERLSDADRQLVPDVEPTADALLERIGSLASALSRLDGDLPEPMVADLDARIAKVEGEPETAPDRERRLTLLNRQRASFRDLDERRTTMRRQLESASLALRSLRLDMVKLRTLGVGSAIGDVTNATQEAHALSREIGRAVEVADELRKL